jgi:hypothetical protein
LPVIVSDRCGCVSDLVREGVNGVTFDPLDVDGLARRMIDFTRGSMDLGGMGAAARETIMGWGCDLFAANLLEAVKAAQASQMPRAAALDVTLLGLVAAR